MKKNVFLAVAFVAGCSPGPIMAADRRAVAAPPEGTAFEEPGFGAKSWGVAYPNPDITPGDVVPGVTAAEVCAPYYARHMRDRVTSQDKDRVFERYGVPRDAAKFHVDHFIPLSLGGSNDPKNLWPIPITPGSGWQEKQQAAAFLHAEVCAGRVGLGDAQDRMRKDWHAVWLDVLARRARSRGGRK